MTLRQADKTTYWRALQIHLRRGTRDNYGITPLVPTEAMLRICQRISNKTNQ